MDTTLFLSRLAQKSSWRTCRYAGMGWGLARYYRRRRQQLAVEEHFNVALPGRSARNLRRIVKHSVQLEVVRLLEMLRLPVTTAGELREYVAIEGMESLEAAAADGRGIISPSSHFGQYELMAARLALTFGVAASAGALPHRREKYLAAARRSAGVNTYPGMGAARVAVEALAAGKLVYVFSDGPGGVRGWETPVLGRVRCMTTSAARLALAHGAPLVPMFPVRRKPWLADGRIVIKVWPPLWLKPAEGLNPEERRTEVQRGTRYYLDALEEMVRAYPEEWQLAAIMALS